MRELIIFALFFSASALYAKSPFLPQDSYFADLAYKSYLLDHKLDKATYEKECSSTYYRSREVWEKRKSKLGPKQPTGHINKPFSKNDMINMKFKNHLNHPTDIRGVDTLTKYAYSISSEPVSPHTHLGCEQFYKDETRIIYEGDKVCREVTITSQNNQISYRQSFCEGDTTIYINFEPIIPSNDCVACEQSRDQL